MNTQLNELRRLLAEIDSLAGSVEVSALIRDARSCAEIARRRIAKAIKIVAELDAQAGQAPDGSAEFSQFLSAVMDAAGLVRHGLRSKELSEYLGTQCMKYRLAAAPAQGGAEHA